MDRTFGKQVSSLYEEIVVQIQKSEKNQIPFVYLMEQALYHPTYGYYTKPTPKLGKAGDFFTNVHISDLFGRVLARYFLHLWKTYGNDNPLVLVEMGSGDGRLLEQIAAELLDQQIPPTKVCFYSIEQSSYHRGLQIERLEKSNYPVFWLDHISQIPTQPFAIVYSNELVDAFPVHRLLWLKNNWQELYVTEQAGELVETFGDLSNDSLHQYCTKLDDDLADKQQIEVNLAAKGWIQEVGEWLTHGFLLTADYGGTSRELRSIRYLDGTMRYYRSHQQINTPYQLLGEVDFTAHVNFDDLIEWGTKCGFSAHFYGEQAKFLINAGILEFTQSKYRNAIKQLLVGMGGNFQILVQQKQ